MTWRYKAEWAGLTTQERIEACAELESLSPESTAGGVGVSAAVAPWVSLGKRLVLYPLPTPQSKRSQRDKTIKARLCEPMKKLVFKVQRVAARRRRQHGARSRYGAYVRRRTHMAWTSLILPPHTNTHTAASQDGPSDGRTEGREEGRSKQEKRSFIRLHALTSRPYHAEAGGPVLARARGHAAGQSGVNSAAEEDQPTVINNPGMDTHTQRRREEEEQEETVAARVKRKKIDSTPKHLCTAQGSRGAAWRFSLRPDLNNISTERCCHHHASPLGWCRAEDEWCLVCSGQDT
ncbi:unnamed protein product [Pleuronectes platessa]|uniref:Uncharacterized protein n=1 Tax=Pleuronectes platessa TaxID=8262 RepID=A0A9N7Z3K0_PLEPL|nr:unnamed protein product [Pleuronectes platessa]